MFSTSIPMVIAAVCQPLAESLPKCVFAAASSSRWNGWGSYFDANSTTSSRVTLHAPNRWTVPGIRSS